MKASAIAAAIVVVGTAAVASPAAVRPAGGVDPGVRLAASRERPFVPGEVVVRFEEAHRGAAMLKRIGARVARRLPLPGTRVVELGRGVGVHRAIHRLERLPGVRYAEPNFIRDAALVPDDPGFGDQWGLHNTGQVVAGVRGRAGADVAAPGAWDLETGDASVVVAVVDDGIDYTHPDLAPNVWTNPGESGGGRESNGLDDDENGFVDDWRGWDFVADRPYARENHVFDFHGTAVGGAIGARGDDGFGVAGLAWDVSLMPVRVLNTEGTGTSADVAAALAYAARNGARVVNGSINGYAGYSQAERDAIAAAPGTLFVFAAGNTPHNLDRRPSYPCAYAEPNLLCVAASDQRDRLAPWSSFGRERVHLAAPGENVVAPVSARRFTTSLWETFEGGELGAWTTGGRRDRWDVSEFRHAGSRFALTDSPEGRYRNRARSRARSPRIDLGDQVRCNLGTSVVVRTEPGRDRFLVQLSRTGRTGSWITERRLSGRREPVLNIPFPEGFHGDRSVYVRFLLRTNGSVRRNGVHVEDVSVLCRSARPTWTPYTGTSLSTPLVSGAAALLIAHSPSSPMAEIRRRILETVDPQPSLAGNVASGGRLNVAAALAAR